MAFVITRSLTQHQSDSVNLVNVSASSKILALYPQWKQANLQAQWSGLVFADAQLGGGVLTNQNGTDGLIIQAAWSWIKSVRHLSNATNEAILAATDYPSILALLSTFNTALAAL